VTHATVLAVVMCYVLGILLQSKDAGIRTLVMLDEQGGQSQITLLSAEYIISLHTTNYL